MVYPPITGDIGDLVRRSVEEAFLRQLGNMEQALQGNKQKAQIHLADLRNRLVAFDLALAEVRRHAPKLAADLQVASERAAGMHARLQQGGLAANAHREAQVADMRAMTDEQPGNRKLPSDR